MHNLLIDWQCKTAARRSLQACITAPNSCADEHSESEPPDPFPNSEVKPLSADGSVAFAM